MPRILGGAEGSVPYGKHKESHEKMGENPLVRVRLVDLEGFVLRAFVENK